MDRPTPLTACFLGPRAENASVWTELFDHIFQDYVHWRRNYFPADPWVVGRHKRRSPEHEAWLDLLTSQLDTTLSELKYHFPLHSPRYNAHMVSEQSLPAVLGYFAGLLYNPNNVTGEAAPVTVALEVEVGRMVAAMLGYDPRRAWAHICSGGTIANLEALWVARSVQFAPLSVREYCKQQGMSFTVRTASGREARIADLDDATLLGLRPQDAVSLFRALARERQRTTGRSRDEVVSELNQHFAGSRFNVARRGLGPVLAALGRRPVMLSSAAAHYSIAKACNVLGYGEDALRLVPVNARFQLDAAALRDAIAGLAEDEYIAAVVGIVGTTEEGAVDPIHRIGQIREELEQQRNRSFWLHIDAAWGGYLRSLFHGLPVAHVAPDEGLDAVAEEYVRALDLHHRFELDVGTDRPDLRSFETRWDDPETCAAFLSVAEGDSVTVDPHKMGYVPYPAGVVAFKTGLVTEFVSQRAEYFSGEADGIGAFDRPADFLAFGRHILEGSKPGAAALACWLAHKTIPLTTEGHGKIVRTTLLSAQRFWRLLTCHPQLYLRLEREREGGGTGSPFTFLPVTEPETNIVCFVARPMEWRNGGMAPAPVTLDRLNRLNQKVYGAASIPGSRSHHPMSAAQPFFVSRTRFENQQYGSTSLRPLLARLGISEAEYVKEGLFVLRSTVMNPWHEEARLAGMDYLEEFLRFLHRATAAAMAELAAAGD